jgi:heme-degrading monooxygenase HmoA
MVHMIVRHKVADYSRWKEAFDAHLNTRKAAGETEARVMISVDDPREVTLFFNWDSLERARRFVGSDDLKQAMKQGGVVGDPEIRFLEDARTVRRSAAD